MTKAVSNRDICFIKAALLLYKHGNFKNIFVEWSIVSLPPNTISVKQADIKKNGQFDIQISRQTDGYILEWVSDIDN